MNGPNHQDESLHPQVVEVAVEIEVVADTEEEAQEVHLPEMVTEHAADLHLLVAAVLPLVTDVAVPLLEPVVLLPLETSVLPDGQDPPPDWMTAELMTADLLTEDAVEVAPVGRDSRNAPVLSRY